MELPRSLGEFLLRPLWAPSARMDWPLHVYRAFNYVEAAAWFVFAALVLARWWRHRRGAAPGGDTRRDAWEWGYALAFVAFGLSDLREAQMLQAWLILAKGVICAAILMFRRVVIRRYYPTSRTY